MANNLLFITFYIIGSFLVLLFIDKCNYSVSFRNKALLLISLLFYAIIDIKFLLLLIIEIVVIFILAKKSNQSKNVLLFGILFIVAILFVFKYFDFFSNSISRVFGTDNIMLLNIIVPIGLSFYSLRLISYLVDVNNQECEVENSIINFALYVSYWPEIISGPISNPKFLLGQIKNGQRIKEDKCSEGMQYVVIGLFKKAVLADNISVFVNEIFRAPNIYSSFSVIMCVIAYGLEIYLDFSGYSDIAIGTSKLFGFDTVSNFNQPYLSYSVTEFWNRWHISLSTWLKKYIYIPLGGNRKGYARTLINLLITMIVSGLWHGNSETFIIWGLLQGMILIFERITHLNKRKGVINIIITDLCILVMWVIFRSSSLNNAFDIYKQIFIWKSGINYVSSWFIIAFIIVVVFAAISHLKNHRNYYYPIQNLKTYKGLLLFFLLIGVVIGFAYTGSNPFIYGVF